MSSGESYADHNDSDDFDAPAIHVDDYECSHPVIPEPLPPDLQHRFRGFNSGLLIPAGFHHGGSDSGSDYQSSCPPSPTPSSSYCSINSPEQLYLSENFEHLHFDHADADNSPVIPYQSTLSTSSYNPSVYNSPSSPSRNPFDVPYADGFLNPHYSQFQPPSGFYQMQNLSSRSLPELFAGPQEDPELSSTQLRRIASSSSMASSRPGPHTPDDTSNHHDVPFPFFSFLRVFSPPNAFASTSESEGSPASPHINMYNIHECIRDHPDEQALNVEEIRRVIATTSPGSREFFKKSVKTSVSTPAGNIASEKRRKNPGRFVCRFCQKSFTRKLGLDNHLKSHLGIVDKQCRFCQRMFATSLGRHMKRCRLNPDRQAPLSSSSSSKETS
ncbi:hypothetical protein CVT25_010840 [Psilocybe cyanescens]|uniref:C2H2-type domain-containing protein n=1 Tax=Psilocybe cyanescens TaxID=93625 RepID=A0A409WF69_PSICY|nr:hypothetical protein CVT25_010840 [Psilocybe cyanescens]